MGVLGGALLPQTPLLKGLKGYLTWVYLAGLWAALVLVHSEGRSGVKLDTLGEGDMTTGTLGITRDAP